ncbi:MAG: RNA polymerase sigma-70 factor [Bacteroidales bacterium]|nr:RNA polymerase sigma-70 factor [Bacteroidales bacterium]
MTHQIEYDQQNFQRFKAGDEKVFELIFRQYYNQIVAFSYSFVDDKYISENVSQESFINLWINRRKVEKPAGIKAFLYTIAKSRSLNYLREKKRHSLHVTNETDIRELEMNVKILESFNFNEYDFIELESMIKEAIEELPERCREVYMKSRFEGKKNAEVAEELNISIQAVEANITRAIKKLRIHLVDYLPAVVLHAIFKIF